MYSLLLNDNYYADISLENDEVFDRLNKTVVSLFYISKIVKHSSK